MNIRKNITRWGPTSLAVLLAASLVGPVYAQPSAEQAIDQETQEGKQGYEENPIIHRSAR